VTSSQIAAGFERVFANISDIALDIPNAHKLLAQYAGALTFLQLSIS